ncbi:MAG TPA: hypothetical protein VEU96_21990 [Bryobacteraceae bacterium]|nr:hypothetical protein [Bryobacteraceae bacterium]
MRYWGFLLAKLTAAALLIWGVWFVIGLGFSRPTVYLNGQFVQELSPFTHDLGYTAVMMLFFALCTGLVYLIIWDQRYRCRTCLRRLRMPMAAGSWPNMLLFGQPRTEYICVYGHGTLKVPEVQITGPNGPDWQPHDDDIWKELESLEESKK